MDASGTFTTEIPLHMACQRQQGPNPALLDSLRLRPFLGVRSRAGLC